MQYVLLMLSHLRLYQSLIEKLPTPRTKNYLSLVWPKTQLD